MLEDIHYDKIKLLHELSRACNFVKKHALPGARKKRKVVLVRLYQDLEKDPEKNLKRLGSTLKHL